MTYGKDGGFGRDAAKGGATQYIRRWKSGLSCLYSQGASKSLDRDDFRLDMNVIDGDIESALPSSAGGEPAATTSAGLAAGKTWFSTEGGFSISVLNLGADACDTAPFYPT